jgi:hypothetical protein
MTDMTYLPLDQMIVRTPIGGGLCPLGYAARIDSLVEALMQEYPQVVLLDIRLHARSRWCSAWNKSVLWAKWGERYVHEKRLGNVNYQYDDRPVKLLDPEAVLPSLLVQLQQGAIFLLLCACKNYDACHRKVVFEYIMQRCADALRSSGMCFNREQNRYIGFLDISVTDWAIYAQLWKQLSLQSSQVWVCVSPRVFEKYRLLDQFFLYDPLFWAMVAGEFPDLVAIEQGVMP